MPEKKPRNKKKGMIMEIILDKDMTAVFDNGILSVKGKKGEVKKKFLSKSVKIDVKEGKIILTSKRSTKRDKKIVETFGAHIKNILKGITEGHKYLLKICSGHFPMSVSANKNDLTVKNFLGEKIPRILKIKEGADVKVEGDQIIVESPNKEIAGQVSADIEQLTRRPGYDSRIFQDGIWLVSKDSKELK